MLEHNARKAKKKTYRARMPIRIDRIESAEVAYTIELNSSDRVHLYSHKGRLYWPLLYTLPFCEPMRGSAFETLSAGTIDPFSNRMLAVATMPIDEDLSWRKIVSTREQETNASVQRKVAANLIVLDGSLYCTGGPPILIAGSSKVDPVAFVTSSGTSRNAEPASHELTIQPAGFHLRAVQDAIARGYFKTDFAGSGAAEPFPRILPRRGHLVDPIDLRVDALFRILHSDIKEAGRTPADRQFETLRAGFLDCATDSAAELTHSRCTVLQSLLYRYSDSLSRRFRDCLRSALLQAARAGRTVHPSVYRKGWDSLSSEIAALS